MYDARMRGADLIETGGSLVTPSQGSNLEVAATAGDQDRAAQARDPLRGDRVQVIERSVDLLEVLADRPLSLTEVCRATGLSKGTAFRLLAGLELWGVVLKDPVTANYMLGVRLLRLADAALAGLGTLSGLWRPVLERLAGETGETVALHIQIGLERVSVDEIPSPQSIRYTSLVGSAAPLDQGASGLILLAFMTEARRRRTLALLETSVDGFDRIAVEEKIAVARGVGWAVDLDERLAGASAVSVPLMTEWLLLSLTVVGPSARLQLGGLKAFVPAMQEAAEQLGSLLADHATASLAG